MRKIISLFLICCFIQISASAVEFDSSIDDSIRKDYDVEALELPALPKEEPTSYSHINEPTQQEIKYNPTGKIYTLKRGTKVGLVSRSKITDWMSVGTKISFTSQQGFVTKEGTIIPAGTIFKGTITDSHRPQLSGNGGLVELKIDEIYFNGMMSKIETNISLANSKKVFFNDIKGKRLYWHNFSKSLTPGKKVFSGAQDCAAVMRPIPVLNVLSVIPYAFGVVVYAANFATAPVIALCTKGGELALPAGTQFIIKISEEAKIYG